MQNLFEHLLSPVAAYFENISAKIDEKSGSKKLFFMDFTRKVLFAFLYGSDSLRSFCEDLKTNDLCKGLGFLETPFSTLKDGFSRFKASDYAGLYEHILGSFAWSEVKGFSELGRICAVDGSFFPTLIQMKWSKYTHTVNACKLHLCLELNRMVATEFLIDSGNSSERNFLISIAKAGVIYISDRGYFSFELAKTLHQLGAFFVLRIKANVLFTVQENLEITHFGKMPTCFACLSDRIITFDNDNSGIKYRLICFMIGTKQFRIITNKLNINTLQVIMLYAFRWQIELVFKFIKRTMKALHFFNHSKNGVKIQIYLILTLALLLLRFKQYCQQKHQQNQQKHQQKVDNSQQKVDNSQQKYQYFKDFCTYFDNVPELFVQNINHIFAIQWKITKRFLQILRNSLLKNIDNQLIETFAII